jgi:hypothetical protein
VPEGERTLRQRIQEQTVRIARIFYDDSLGRLEGVLQGDRAQLEYLAEQLPEGDAEARIRDMAGSYTKIEESLHRTARDIRAKEAVSESARQAQEETAGESERAVRGARHAAGAAASRVTGAVGQASGQVGQIGEGEEAVGQILDRIGQVAENLPGGHLLNRTTNEAGQTVQRAVDESGVVVEITLDEACNLVSQKPVGSLAELPAEEEYQNQQGQTIRTVKEESGTLIELRLGEDGSILDLQVPPSSKI